MIRIRSRSALVLAAVVAAIALLGPALFVVDGLVGGVPTPAELILLLPTLIPGIGLLLIVAFWDRLDGSVSGVHSVTVPTTAPEWCADVRDLLDDIDDALAEADAPIEETRRRRLLGPTTHLQRFVERAPSDLEDDLVVDLHAIEVRCWSVVMGRESLTGYLADAEALDWLRRKYVAVTPRLDRRIGTVAV